MYICDSCFFSLRRWCDQGTILLESQPRSNIYTSFLLISFPKHIGRKLSSLFKFWVKQAVRRTVCDPCSDTIQKRALEARRNTGNDHRVLYHYNGHGVPQPSDKGEIWVFSKNFTQYMPLNVIDLISWVGFPGIFMFDCSCAGRYGSFVYTYC